MLKGRHHAATEDRGTKAVNAIPDQVGTNVKATTVSSGSDLAEMKAPTTGSGRRAAAGSGLV